MGWRVINSWVDNVLRLVWLLFGDVSVTDHDYCGRGSMSGQECVGLAYRHGMHSLRNGSFDRLSHWWCNGQAWMVGSADADWNSARIVHEWDDSATRTEGWLAAAEAVLEKAIVGESVGQGNPLKKATKVTTAALFSLCRTKALCLHLFGQPADRPSIGVDLWKTEVEETCDGESWGI